MVRLDKIRLRLTRLERVLEVTYIVKMMVENRLRWFEHVEKRSVNYVVRRVDQMEKSQITRV